MSCPPTFSGWVAVIWEKTQFFLNLLSKVSKIGRFARA